jgi:UrcA family protein
MYKNTAVRSAWTVLCAAFIAGTLCTDDAVAQGSEAIVAYHVSTQGIDVSKPEGARELYRRLKNAAWIVCTRANRVGLEPSPDPDACYEKALGEAISSAHIQLLTQAYLETHSLRQAAAHGIEVPVQEVAAK